jgi:tetratricopeptide (TPR) repeat protein
MVADNNEKDEDAIDAYEKAIALDDAFLDAHKNLAILCTARNPMYSNKARTEKAFKHYARYFELGGNDPELEQVYKTIKEVLPHFVK